MMYNNGFVSIETEGHVIEISDGCLTIDTKHFPDDCVSLTQEETEEVLNMLLQWKYGSVVIPPGGQK